MKSYNNLEFIGAALTIVGSFLPWEQVGDFVFIVTDGIQIDFANFKYWITGIHVTPIYDHGGVSVILLTYLILILSAGLMGLSLFFIVRWLLRRYWYGNAIGQPTLMIGLVCVVLGSAILLSRAALRTIRSTIVISIAQANNACSGRLGVCAFSGSLRGSRFVPPKWRYLSPPLIRR